MLLALTTSAYVPALRGGYVWDDTLYVSDNATLRTADGLRRIWVDPLASPQYYPLVFTSFWIEYRLWGADPRGYHATNVALHGINAILVWNVLSSLNVPGALLAAGIFALHPVHVESVAWISERKNLLSGMFALLTVLAWLRFVTTQQLRSYVVALVCLTAALLSKTQVATLPLALWLLAWWQRPAAWRRHTWLLLPHLFVCIALAGVTVWREHLNKLHGLPLPALSTVDRGLIVGRALWFYIGTLVWPADLMTIYPQWHVDSAALWQYAFPVAAIVCLALLWRSRRRIGAGPLVATLLFIINLGPALGFVNFGFMRYSFVADHFQYLASIGVIALAAAAVTRRGGMERRPWPLLLVAALVWLTLATLTWRRSETYRDEETLWRDNLARNSAAPGVHDNLGLALLQRDMPDAAIAHFAAALKLNPADAEAHFHWGRALASQSQMDEAIAHFAAAVRISPDYAAAHNDWGNAAVMRGNLDEAIEHFALAAQQAPDYAPAQSNWCAALTSQGKTADALEHCAAAVRSQPEYAQARNNWGMTLLELGRLNEAAAQFAAAVRLKPGYAEAHDNWGMVLQKQGRLDEAIAHYSTATNLFPTKAATRDRLGTALLSRQRIELAIAQFAAAVDIDPQDAAAQDHLGVALTLAHQPDQAIEHFATAAHLRPDSAEVQNHWGIALGLAGRAANAVTHFAEAVRLQPNNEEARTNLEKARRDLAASSGGAN